MDDISLARSVSEGKRAELLIKDEAYQRWCKQIEHDLIDAWINSNPRDAEGREKLFFQLHAGRKYHDLVHTVASNGRLAQRDIDTVVDKPKKHFGIV